MSNSEKKPFQLLRFLWKHKNEILGAAVCVAVSAYTLYELGKPTSVTNDEEKHEEDLRIPITTTISPQRQRRNATDQTENTRLSINLHFDKIIRILIPLIRAKVNDTIDVNSAIRKIKELRGEEPEHDTTNMRITEAMLWEDVKVSSLTLLFVSTYLVSAVTVLLRVHLHMMMGNKSMLHRSRSIASSDGSRGSRHRLNGDGMRSSANDPRRDGLGYDVASGRQGVSTVNSVDDHEGR